MSDKPRALLYADLIEERYPLSGQVQGAASELRRLHAECEALRADAGRLDWIDAHWGRIFEHWDAVAIGLPDIRLGYCIDGGPPDFINLREAIDAAMAKEQTK